MGNTLLADLMNAQQLAIYHHAIDGSLLDKSGHGLVLSPEGSGHKPAKVNGRNAWAGTASTGLQAGTSATLDLTTATLFYAAQFRGTPPATYAQMICKSDGIGTNLNGYSAYISSNTVSLALGDASVAQTFGPYSLTVGQIVLIAHAWNGTNIWSWVNGVQVDVRAQTRVPNSAGKTYRIGVNASYGLQNVGFMLGGMISRVLTGAEVARLYDDFLASRPSADLPRRNFYYSYPVPGDGSDAAYNAAGIVLDTNFTRRRDGKIVDLSPSGYVGTITGVPTPGANGESMSLAVTDTINHGDVTQLNSVAAFSIEQQFDLPTTNIPSSLSFTKFLNASNNVQLGPTDTAASTQKLHFLISNAGAADAKTTATVLRSGCKQHVMGVFNGNGATDPLRAQVYVDGEAYPLTIAIAIPASTPNLAGVNLYAGYISSLTMPAIYKSQRLYTGALTATQVRAAYLKNFAQRVTLKETLEDVPVSLVASVSAGSIGSFQLLDGTWANQEDSTGKRWLVCVTGGDAAIPQQDSFGTFVIPPVIKANIGTTMRIMFAGSQRSSTEAAGQNGYLLYYQSGTNTLVFDSWTNGAAAADLFYTAGNYIVSGTAYWHAVSRRPSDGRFALWIKGGAYANWTLVSTVGGAGTNPSAGDATYVTSKWLVLHFAAGDKICLFDPADKRVALWHYQGQLDPTAGEILGG